MEIHVFYHSKEGVFNKKVIRLIQQFKLKNNIICHDVLYDDSMLFLLPDWVKYSPAMAVYEMNNNGKKYLTFTCQKNDVFDSLLDMFNLDKFVLPSKKQITVSHGQRNKKKVNVKKMDENQRKAFYTNIHAQVGSNQQHEVIDNAIIDMQPKIDDYKHINDEDNAVNQSDLYSLRGAQQSIMLTKANPRSNKRHIGKSHDDIINLVKTLPMGEHNLPATMDCHMKK